MTNSRSFSPWVAIASWLSLMFAFSGPTLGQCKPAFLDAGRASMVGGAGGPGLSASAGWTAGSSIERSGPGIVTTFRLTSSGVAFDSIIGDPAALDFGYFGWDCSLSGDRLAVSAGSDSPFQAYVFDHMGDAWVLSASLRPDWKAFGDSIAVDSDILILGSASDSRKASGAGAAYIFRRGSDGVWRQDATLFAPDPKKEAYFGDRVALSGGVALVGADGDSTVGADGGAAYIFRYDGTAWAFEQKFVPDAPGQFGWSVALDSGTAVVSAVNEGSGGAAYIYGDTGSGWVRQAKFLVPHGDFGIDASAAGGLVAVADNEDDDGGQDAGAVYLYKQVAGEWTQVFKVLSPKPVRAGFMGAPVALTDQFLVAVDYPDGDSVIDTFALTCRPDCNEDCKLNINDFICFQSEWRRRTGYGDYDGSATYTINDFIAFSSDWEKGCP